MIIFKHANTLSRYLHSLRNSDTTIGFVPTMGALHAGHLSLVEKSKVQSGLTVCSIFVNPTQFNDPNDYKKYPVELDKDIQKLESVGTDIVFIPDAAELYPGGHSDLERYDLGYLETVLEGKFRPGHFQGVCQVMSRLLRLVEPDTLFMGQKDYQQSLVIAELLKIMKGNTKLVVVPTVRESNGLALSSRNMRLSVDERTNAGNIFQTLRFVKNNLGSKPLAELKSQASSLLVENGFTVDYIEVAEANTLRLLDELNGKPDLVALVAVFLRDVRLIDNMLLRNN